MKIHTIKIRRIREIESLDIECADHPMIAIVGENGSGKTTVFFSLLFALTGVLTLKGKKEEHVRDVGDGPAWVEVTFEVNGLTATIRRSMNSATCTLKIDGVEKPIKGSAKVNGWLLEQGLYPERIIQAFLPQGDADALFKASDAERATASLRIFGMSDIECYDDALKAAAEPLKQRIDVTVEERLEEAQAQKQIAEHQLAKADARLAKAVENRGVLADAEAVIRQSEARKAADSKRAEILALRERDTQDQKQLKTELASEQEQRDLLKKQVAEATEAYDRAKATIYAASQFQQEEVQRVHLRQEEHKAQAALFAAETSLKKAQDALAVAGDPQELQADLRSAQRQLEASRVVQAAHERQAASRGRLEAAQAAAAQLEADLASKPPQDELLADKKAFVDQLALWRHQQQNARDGLCGTCGQVWADVPSAEELAGQIQQAEEAVQVIDQLLTERSNLQHEIERQRGAAQLAQEAIAADDVEIQRALDQVGLVDLGDVSGLEAMKRDLEGKIATAGEARERETAARHRIELAQQQVKSVADRLAAMQGREVPASEVAEAEQLTSAFEEKKQQMQATALRYDMLAKRISDLDARLVGYESDLLRLQEVTEGDDMAADVITQAQEIIHDSDAIHAEYDAAMSEQAGIKREFEMFARSVTELTAKFEQQKIDRKKLDVIRGARFILHREQLPRFVCSYYTELVSQQWGEELERFGAKFTAWQDPENLEFYARFQNGNERRVYQLSGGERQLAIVAYLRVINRLFANLGILGFDEPTTHVDERFRPVIAEVFRRMAAQADSEGLQVFVVDHAPEFLAAIPAAVRLSKSA